MEFRDSKKFLDSILSSDAGASIQISSVIVGMRKWIYRSYFHSYNLFGLSINILGWNEKGFDSFLYHLIKKKKISNQVKDKMCDLSLKISLPVKKGEILSYNPFEIVMLIDILKCNKDSLEDIGGSLPIESIIKEYVSSICKKDSEGKTEWDKLLKALSEFGWLVRENGISRVPYNPDSLINKITAFFSIVEKEQTKETILRFYTFYGHKASPKHVLFEEYFIAERIINCFLNSNDVSSVLGDRSILSSSSNRMIPSLVHFFYSNKIDKIIDNLKKEYETVKSHSEKLVVLYTLPRFSFLDESKTEEITKYLEDRFKLLDIEAKEDKDSNLEIVPILIWLSQMGNLEFEKLYYDRIFANKTFDSINRGCHLVYYHDVEKPFGYRDMGFGSWSNTAKSFMEHYAKPCHIRHLFLRRLDMAIVRSFVLSHKEIPQEIIDFFDKMTANDIKTETLDCCIDSKSKLSFREHLREKGYSDSEFEKNLEIELELLKDALKSAKT